MKNTILICFTLLICASIISFGLVLSASYDRYEEIDKQNLTINTTTFILDKKTGNLMIYFRDDSEKWQKEVVEIN